MLKRSIIVTLGSLLLMASVVGAKSLDYPLEMMFRENFSEEADCNSSRWSASTRFFNLPKVASYESGWGPVQVDTSGVENEIRYNVSKRMSVAAERMEYVVDGDFSGQWDRNHISMDSISFDYILTFNADRDSSPLLLGITYSYMNPTGVDKMQSLSAWKAFQNDSFRLRAGVDYRDIPGLDEQFGVSFDLIVPLEYSDTEEQWNFTFFLQYATNDFYKAFLQHVVTGNAPSHIGSVSLSGERQDALNAGVRLKFGQAAMQFSIYDVNDYMRPVLEFNITN